MTRICDLPNDLVGENILTRVPITSLKAVRSTCKLWNDLSYELIVGKATTRHHELLGFMTVWDKVCSVRFDLQGIRNNDDEDLVKPSIKKISLLNQVNVCKVFHFDGLLLCVIKNYSETELVVWNPYLGQIRRIEPIHYFNWTDRYVIGCDSNRNHKILRLPNDFSQLVELGLYDFSSDSWRVRTVTLDFEIDHYQQRDVTLKGNTYFFAVTHKDEYNFLLCFDFTRKRFGHRLPLPINSYNEFATLSCVREEQLSVLYEKFEPSHIFEIWVTNKIEPNAVSWSKLFLKVDMGPLTAIGFMFDWEAGSFFIDEEKKLAVVFDERIDDDYYAARLRAYIIGEDGYFKSVSLEESWDLRLPRVVCSPRVSSSYLPSLVQIKQPHKSIEEDA